MTTAPSLIRRLWVASLLVLPVLIGFSALTLNRAFVQSVESAEHDALLAQIYALIALAEPSDTTLTLPLALPNPRFETPDSGLYARVLNANGDVVWQTQSLETSNEAFPTDLPSAPGQHVDVRWDIDNKAYRALRFTTIWEINAVDSLFTFEVIHARTSIEQDISNYQRSLVFWLGGMALLLILIQSGIARWSLRPLKQLASEINAIETGQSHQLQHEYPVEIQPVTHSVNTLLISENAQRERYKHSLSDLAHSLKTPLSVIRAQLEGSDKDQLVDEQVERMSSIISHQLKRANAQVQNVYGPSITLAPLCQRICNALDKVYRDKQLQFTIDLDPTLRCNASEDDLMEVLGNIIENACKYGHSEIIIHAQTERDGVNISIGDDGKGIQSSQAEQILSRGARADTSTLGQGIGLAVAVDIISSYNGGLSIAQSPLGGAQFNVMLPRALVR